MARRRFYGARVGRASNERFLSRMDGRVGVGRAVTNDDVPCAIDLVLGRRATATGATMLGTLSRPAPQHVAYLAAADDGYQVRPTTIVVNQNELLTPAMVAMHRGPVQLGVADAVMTAPMLGQLTAYLLGEIIVLVSVHLPGGLGSQYDVVVIRALVRAATERALLNATDALPFHAVVPVYPTVKLARAAR